MRLLGLDFETTGLDTNKDHITEMGLAIWDVPMKRPLVTLGMFFWNENYAPLTDEIIKLTGLTDGILQEFGTCPKKNLEWLEGFVSKHKIDYVVAHNGENFDKPFLYSCLTRLGVEAPTLRGLPWIDTRTDIPFPTEPDSRRLRHLALDCGFINPFEHRAVFDVLTMMKVLSHYDIQQVLACQKIPFKTVRAMVGYEDRQLAKEQRYSWEKLGDKTYPKCWVKRIKEDKLEAERKACKFPVVVIE